MKNNFLSKAYGGVMEARRKLNGLGLPRQWKVMTSTLLLLFTLAIGNVLADTFTASEIAAKSGDVNVGTTKNHVTVSSLGITSTTNTQIWKDGSTAKNEAAVVLSAEPTSSGDTYNKSASFVEIRAERGYALGSTISVRGGSTQDGAKLAVIVYWDGEASPTFTSYDATNLSLGGKKQTSNPSDINLTVPEGTRTARIYKKVKVTDATNLISGNASSSKGNGYAAIVHVIATAVLSPEIDGVSQMFNDETITLTGYPAGGSWDVVSGPGAIASDGKLTASGNGTIRVSYTKDDKTGYKDITAAATKQITFDFTAGVLPTVSGFTLTNLSATFDGANGLKMGSNGQGVRISSTTYDFTNAIVSAKASSTSKKISYNLHANAVDVTNDPEFATVGTSFTEYNKDINSQIFTVFRSGGSTTNFNYIILTVKKHVAAATYDVTLIPAGGSIDPVPSGWTYDDVNDKYIKADVEDGSSVALLALTKDGYKLNGWKDGENADYTSPVTIDGADLTLTAQWAQTYAVTYVPNNGVLPAETMTDNNAPYKAGDEVTLLANTFTAPENKEFDVWVVTPTAGGDPITVTAGKFTMPAAAVTVTATWKDACAAAPTVSAPTLGTTSYTTQVVNCAGISVLGSAGCTISEYGFVYGTTTAPTISDNKKALEGDYTVAGTAFPATTLTGLAMNTKYYVRAYATNSYGTAYGDEVNFTTLESLGNVLVVASSASQTSDAITALRDNGFMVTVSAHDNSRSYTGYDLVVLDESLGGSDAQTTTNEESKIKDVNIPILNLKAFFYTKTNRWNWGTPVNGTSGNEIANISTAFCNAQSHPIFAGLTINDGEIDLIDPAKSGNTLQGVTTNTLVEGKEGYTLATSGTGITFIHELTPSQRGVDAKYLMIAISNNAKDNLSADGEKLIVNAAKYLVGSTAWTPVLAPVTTGITATPAASYSEGDNIALSISATNVDAETTYTWYKGATLDAAKAAGAIQTAKTAVEGGTSYAKASCEVADAGIYWCVISAGCEVASSLEVTVTTCTKPGTPDNLASSDITYTTANFNWDEADNSDGYKVSIIKQSDASVIVDWTDCATNEYAASELTQGTEYTFKVKAKGAMGYCEFGIEATVDFTTKVPSVADLVTIADDYTFTPTAAIDAGTFAESNKFFAAGTGDCDMSDGKMRVKENRALAFKVADNAKIKVTFATKSGRQIQLGTALSEGNYTTYGSSESSPYTFDVVTTGGVVYLTAHSDQLYFSQLEIMYPHTVTYALNGGDGTTPTQASKYVGETFTAHDGTTDITAPIGKEFSKWVDQDEADVLGGATYTMPAKAVTLTAQWIDPPTRYTVSFDLQGHGSAITSQSVADGEKALKPADPSESGWEFEGWYTDEECTAGNEFDFNTAIIADRPLFAKWTEFDACAVLTPATSGETIGVGDAISLQAGSVGGTMEAVVKSGETTTNLVYTENGLAFNSSGDRARVKVTLSHKLQKGSIIRVTLKANGDNSRDRGLDIYNEAGTKKGFLGFAKDGYENGDVAKFSYVVTDDDGLKNTKIFYFYRNNSVWMADLKVANCAPQDFTVTYKDGETTLGTEDVFENGHPTAVGVNTRKNGYIFDGWAETDGGAVVNLSTITITAAKTLYAKYTARDCSGIGSKFKFVVATDQSNGNLMASAPNSMALTTENYLSELAGGELVASIEGTSNNRITYSDKKGISFPNGDGGKLTIKLDCPLQENDEIRFINYASNGNGLTLSDGTNSLELPSNNASTVQTITVPAAWETTASYELTLVRVSGKTPKISYFEIYRRPALESVTVADLTVREGASVTPVMTLTPSDALVTSQVWSIVSGDDKIDIDPATGEVTGVAAGDAEIKVVLNGIPAMSATATVHVVETFVQEDVTESITWDFSKAGATSQFNEQVLANVDGVTLDASQFEATKLVGSANNITDTYFQGTMLTFNATKAGLLNVRFTNGNAHVRTLKVYVGDPEVEIASWSYSNAAVENKCIEVPAGKVTLRSYQETSPNNVRIMNLEFLALAHRRTAAYSVGELGTICLEDDAIAVGANVYELQGHDENGKMVFEKIESGEIEAGMPYLFQATNASQVSFYKKVNATHADDAGSWKGMYGTFVDKPLSPTDDVDMFYFSGTHIWAVKDFTVASITIPAHRCYVNYAEFMEYPVGSSTPLPGRKRMLIGVNGAPAVATGIDQVPSDQVPSTKVIIDGHLYILRGEKMYDAKGQLVK